MASLADLQTALDANTAAVAALTAAAGGLVPPDFQPQVDQINASTAAVNAVTAQISPPP